MKGNVDLSRPSDSLILPHTPLAGAAARRLLADTAQTCTLQGRWAVTHALVLCCSQDEWRYLLSGGAVKEVQENPAPDWLNERAWGDILALSNLKNFSGFANDFVANLAAFRAIFDSHKPHRQVSQALSVLLCCARHAMASLEEHEVPIQP